MRLCIVDHLQAMLETAEEPIVVDQLSDGCRVDPAGRGEATQRLASRSGPQLAQPTTPDQLVRLRKEFDFADPAATGLDVMALDGDSPPAAIGVDLPLDRVDVLNSSKIEVLPPDKGFQLAQKMLPGDPVTSYRTSLYECCPFPILADALIVGKCSCDRQRQRGGCRVRPQPQIGAKYIAVAGPLVEDASQITRQAHKEGLNAVTRARSGPARVIKKDQIYIARIIKFIPTKLAHAEDDEPTVALRIVYRLAADTASARRLTQQMAQGGPEHPLGKPGKSTGLLLERPGADQFSHGGDKRDPSFGDAQAPHKRCHIFAKIGAQFDSRSSLREERVGTFLDKAGQECPIFDRDSAQKRTVAKDRREQTLAARRRAPLARRLNRGVASGDRQRLVPSLEPERKAAFVGRFG